MSCLGVKPGIMTSLDDHFMRKRKLKSTKMNKKVPRELLKKKKVDIYTYIVHVWV